MAYVYVAGGKPNSIGQLKGTLGHLFAVELLQHYDLWSDE
jgi:hypothetical protein